MSETPAPQAPDDPTRTREAIERRITALLTHDYHGDTETQALCHEAAKMARRYFYGDEIAYLWLRLAERAAAQSDRLEELGEDL